MVTIYNYQNSDLIFTLNENTTIPNANYILNLFSNQNHDNNLFWLTGDTSPNINRWNEYQWTSAISNGLIAGTYDYFVYQTSGSTLSLSGMTTEDIVESGLATVIGTNPTQTTYNNPVQEYTFE
jgi:hypothetical protein